MSVLWSTSESMAGSAARCFQGYQGPHVDLRGILIALELLVSGCFSLNKSYIGASVQTRRIHCIVCTIGRRPVVLTL